MAWDDTAAGTSFVAALDATPPYAFTTPAVEVGGDGIVRAGSGRALHLSRATGELTILEPLGWTVDRQIALGASIEARDAAIVDRETAYVSQRQGSTLLRVDLESGTSTAAVDLGPLGVGDGNPAVEMMLVHDGRLFIQLAAPSIFPPEPHFLAVVDLASETLVDVDPAEPGTQAIRLSGTAPRFKMQVIPETQHLLVSATGAFLDDGGLEVVDLASLSSLGVAIREFVDVSGNDLGPFAMMNSDRGWLVFSTDIVLSSHLHPFTLSGGGNTPETDVSLFYFAPALVYASRTETIFWPEPNGVQAFDAVTGAPRAAATSLSGLPTDLELLPSPNSIPALSHAAVFALAAGLAAIAIRRLHGRSGQATRLAAR